MSKLLMYVRFVNGRPMYRLEQTPNWIAEPVAMWLYKDVQYHLVKEDAVRTQFDEVEAEVAHV
jgi:hypothetical protein